MTAKEAMRIIEQRHFTAPEAYEVVHALFEAERRASERDEWEKKDESSRESLHSEMIRAERAEADVEKLKMDAEHLQYERDEARETNVRLVAALVAIEDHHGETEDWRDIARSALAEARKEKI